MALSRQEINLRRLLAKCELMCKGKQKSDEKIPQYINSLENMFEEIKTMNGIGESLNDYERRITNLQIQLGLKKQYNTIESEENEISTRDHLLGVKRRQTNKQDGKDFDELITYHQDMQEKIAKDMLILTTNLKEQSQLANKIIKKDTEVVSRSSQLSEQNFNKLKEESIKLAEHSKRAWKCWLWLMLIVVVVVFINMVLFMKVVKKSK